jgi:hypothetical protein
VGSAVGTNAHFVGGMLGFVYLIGARSYFHVQGRSLRASAAGFSVSGFMLMLSIVNRTVAKGGGDASHRYGSSILALWGNYLTLLAKRAFNPRSIGVLEISSIFLMVGSAFFGARALLQQSSENSEKD